MIVERYHTEYECPICRFHFLMRDYDNCPNCGYRLEAYVCKFCGYASPFDMKKCPRCSDNRIPQGVMPPGISAFLSFLIGYVCTMGILVLYGSKLFGVDIIPLLRQLNGAGWWISLVVLVSPVISGVLGWMIMSLIAGYYRIPSNSAIFFGTNILSFIMAQGIFIGGSFLLLVGHDGSVNLQRLMGEWHGFKLFNIWLGWISPTGGVIGGFATEFSFFRFWLQRHR